MQRQFSRAVVLVALFAVGCSGPAVTSSELASPDGSISVRFEVSDGTPTYRIDYKGSEVVGPSTLGLELQDVDDLAGSFQITAVVEDAHESTWEPVWGTASEISNHYNAMTVELRESGHQKRVLGIEFRAFDDGVAFRYLIPEQSALSNFVINDEFTTFALPAELEAYIGIMRDDGWGKSQQVEYPRITIGDFPIDKRATFPALVNTGTAWAAVTEAGVVDYADALLERPGGTDSGLQIRLNRAPGAERSEIPSVHRRAILRGVSC